jgi:hypothetical protein
MYKQRLYKPADRFMYTQRLCEPVEQFDIFFTSRSCIKSNSIERHINRLNFGFQSLFFQQ